MAVNKSDDDRCAPVTAGEVAKLAPLPGRKMSPAKKDPSDAHHQNYRKAAIDAATQTRLLPGENPDTIYLDDAAHWIAVYGELLSFKTEMLRVAKDRMKSMTAPANSEVANTDRLVLEAERKRFVRRLKYWQKRHRELAEA